MPYAGSGSDGRKMDVSTREADFGIRKEILILMV